MDDEPIVRDVLRGMLEGLGFSAELAGNGQDGVAGLTRDPFGFRAVFLDLNMPGLSPEETLRQIREIRSDLPLVICSGYGGEEILSRIATLGSSAFLQKPFALDGVVRALLPD